MQFRWPYHSVICWIEFASRWAHLLTGCHTVHLIFPLKLLTCSGCLSAPLWLLFGSYGCLLVLKLLTCTAACRAFRLLAWLSGCLPDSEACLPSPLTACRPSPICHQWYPVIQWLVDVCVSIADCLVS